MDWKAANEQQDEARWRVFLMFVAMVVLVIRTGLVSRGVLPACPAESAPRAAVPAADRQPSPMSPAELRQKTLVLLCLAEAAGYLVILSARAIWELMNQPTSDPSQERPRIADRLCERSVQRLDSS